MHIRRFVDLALVIVAIAPSTARGQVVPLTSKHSVDAPPEVPAGAAATDSTQDCSKISRQVRRSYKFWGVAQTPRAAEAYFGKKGTSVGGNSALAISDSAATLYTEVISDYTPTALGLGYARIGLGLAVAKAKSDKDSAALDAQKLLGAGGNAIVYGALPLFHYESRARTCAMSRLDLLFVPRVGGQLPEMGSTSNDREWTGDMGAEGHWTFLTVGQNFQFFTNARAARLGGDKDFIKRVRNDSSSAAFWYGRLEFGVDLIGKFRFSIERFVAGPHELLQHKTAVRFQLIETS
jgi:hypothetical protein